MHLATHIRTRWAHARTALGLAALLGLAPRAQGQTYCTAGAATPGSAGITKVVFNTINNSSSANPAYTDFTSLSTSVTQGSTYALSVTIKATGLFATNTATAWIDWNRNGVFDANETYDLGTVNGLFGSNEDLTSNSPLNITVPLSAVAGSTRMRIRTRQGSAPPACGNVNNSEAEDYTVVVVALPVCSGTPTPGNTTTSNAAPCPGTTFNLGIQYPSTDLGLTYQWESSTSGAGGPFANNGLGTASTQSTSAMAPTWYRLRVTCSGNTGSSTPVLVTPTITTGCYCTVSATLDDATGITNVTFGSINNSTGTTGAYTSYVTWSNTVEQGLAYPLSVRVNTAGNYKVYAKAWIDWDHNGVFDATEACDLGTATNVANGTTNLSPVQVNVPPGALQGTTIMRVRATYNTAATPCGNQNYSETEDYSVFVMPQHNTCATAYPVACGSTYPGRTTGVAPGMPANACPFNGPASTGGQNWWKYTATGNDAVTLSTCGNNSFDTRLSVFTGTDCNNLACMAMNDDAPGCPNGGSQLTINTTTGSTYWIAVHGAGAAEGNYQLGVSCSTVCPPPPNHLCSGATPMPFTLATGAGTPAQFNNACAPVGGPTTCSGALPVSGVWFSFNSGTHSRALLTLKDHNTNGSFTATQVNAAVYGGTCAALGATGSIACQPNAAGTQVLGGLAPNTEYKVLVYNNGSAGVAGTFGLLLEHPAHNDASISAIISPAPGAYCGAQLAPVATLSNNGDDDLTSVQIAYGLSGGVQHSYTWTGNLSYGQSVNVTLPSVPAEVGTGLMLTIATSLPNGQADEIPANDAKTVVLNTGGEPVV
ncbi:MAG: hypothetical protein JSS84_10495, partial [Bacteroidetes bacterium]|nr:hypothetical protein [Bacteroidota bacterium]